MQETLIIGAGILGLSIAESLCARGHVVTLLERGPISPARQPSHLLPRASRHAYAHLPALLDLATRCPGAWRALARRVGDGASPEPVGAIQLGAFDHPLFSEMLALDGYGQGAISTSTQIDPTTHADALRFTRESRLPHPLLFEANATRHDAARVQRALLASLHTHRANILPLSHVTSITPHAKVVRATLESGEHVEAARLILCPGAGLPELLRGITGASWQPSLTRRAQTEIILTREPSPSLLPLHRAPMLDHLGDAHTPSFFGMGLPEKPDAFKLTIRADASAPGPHAWLARIANARRLATRFLPGQRWRTIETSRAIISSTPDRLFLLGPHPEHPAILIAAGLSGHGYKFAPLLATILTDHLLDDAPLPAIFSPTRTGVS